MRTWLMLVAGLLASCGETVLPAQVCVEQPFRAGLHVDASDPRMVWATNYATDEDVLVRPRPPERFTFDRDRPTLLLNGDGDLLSKDGEITRTGCFNASSHTLYIGAQDVPDPNRPPN
jgi:hypothetical protein